MINLALERRWQKQQKNQIATYLAQILVKNKKLKSLIILDTLAVTEITDKDKIDNKDMCCVLVKNLPSITQHSSQTMCHPSINKCFIRSYILVYGYFVFLLTRSIFHFVTIQSWQKYFSYTCILWLKIDEKEGILPNNPSTAGKIFKVVGRKDKEGIGKPSLFT